MSTNKAKHFANQLLPDVINALAFVSFYFLRAEQTGSNLSLDNVSTKHRCEQSTEANNMSPDPGTAPETQF